MDDTLESIIDFLSDIFKGREKKGYLIESGGNGSFTLKSTIFTVNADGLTLSEEDSSGNKYKGEYERFREYIKKDIEEVWSTNENYLLSRNTKNGIEYDISTQITLGSLDELNSRLVENSNETIQSIQSTVNDPNEINEFYRIKPLYEDVLQEGECLFVIKRSLTRSFVYGEGGRTGLLSYPYMPREDKETIMANNLPYQPDYDPTGSGDAIVGLHPHIPAHEFGHVLGLADRYCTLMTVGGINSLDTGNSNSLVNYGSNSFGSSPSNSTDPGNAFDDGFAIPEYPQSAYLPGRMKLDNSAYSSENDPYQPPYNDLKPYLQSPWTDPISPGDGYNLDYGSRGSKFNLEGSFNENYIDWVPYDEEYYTGFNWLHNIMAVGLPVVSPYNPNASPSDPEINRKWLYDTSLTYRHVFRHAWEKGANGSFLERSSSNPNGPTWQMPSSVSESSRENRMATVAATHMQLGIITDQHSFEKGDGGNTNGIDNQDVWLKNYIYLIDYGHDYNQVVLGEFEMDSMDRRDTDQDDGPGSFRNRGSFIGMNFNQQDPYPVNPHSQGTPVVVSDLHFKDTTEDNSTCFYYQGQNQSQQQRQSHRISIDDNMDFRASDSEFLETMPTDNDTTKRWSRIKHENKSTHDYPDNSVTNPFKIETFIDQDRIKDIVDTETPYETKLNMAFGNREVLAFLRHCQSQVLNSNSNSESIDIDKFFLGRDEVDFYNLMDLPQTNFVRRLPNDGILIDFTKLDDQWNDVKLNPYQSDSPSSASANAHDRPYFLWNKWEEPQKIPDNAITPPNRFFTLTEFENAREIDLFTGTIDWLSLYFSPLNFGLYETNPGYGYNYVSMSLPNPQDTYDLWFPTNSIRGFSKEADLGVGDDNPRTIHIRYFFRRIRFNLAK